MLGWYGPITTPACAGADGVAAATVTTNEPINGFIAAVSISYVGDDPGTTDTTIATLGTLPYCPAYNILVVSNSATDALHVPRKACVDAAGAANGEYVYFPVNDKIVVTVAQANTGDIIKVWLYMVD
jgi:hypothetical protein